MSEVGEIVALSTVRPGDRLLLADEKWVEVKRICTEREPKFVVDSRRNPVLRPQRIEFVDDTVTWLKDGDSQVTVWRKQ